MKAQTQYLLAAACFTPLFFGCNGHSTRADDKQAMVDRYHQVRSGLMNDMAMSQLQTGDLDQAADSVAEGLMIDPNHVGLFILAGRIELERSRLERSYNAFEKAIELITAPDPDNPEEPVVLHVGQEEQLAEAHYYRAIVLQRWQRPEAALVSYGKAFSLRGENPSYMLAKAEAMVEIGQVHGALEMIEAHHDHFAQNATVAATLAHLYKMIGEDRKALGLFREASVLDPKNNKVREEYALQLLKVGETATGVGVLENVLKDPTYKNRTDLERKLAQAYAQINQLSRAREIYTGLTKRRNAQVTDWIEAGKFALNTEDFGAALSIANRITTMNDSRPEGYLLAGLVWKERGRIDRALAMFDEAAERSPENSDPLVLRGLTLQNAGQVSGATEAYQDALDRNPNDTRAKRLLEQISVVEP